MIEEAVLQRVADDLVRQGGWRCLGELVLAVQQVVYGSETLALDAEQWQQVVRFVDPQPQQVAA